jgi:hypothetical protein
MAISILHTTTASITNASFNVTIPATTAGSCIIVSVTTVAGSGPANSVLEVVDNINPSIYFQTATGSRANDGGIGRTCNVFYFPNTVSGVTIVSVIPLNGTGMNMYCTIYEAAGVAVSSPLENNAVASGTDSTTTTTGPTLSTAFTNSLFISPGVRASAASWPVSAGSGFSQDFTNSSGVSTSTDAHKIASGSNTISYTHASGTAPFLSGLAIFKPYVPSKSSSMLLMFN